MKRKKAYIEMDDVCWKMLSNLRKVVQARALQRGLGRVNQPQLVGAILSYFFLRHHDAVFSEQSHVALETTKEYLGKFFSPEELGALDASSFPKAKRARSSEDVRARKRSRGEG